MALHPQQVNAVVFLNDWLASPYKEGCLQGYAGTGKTWLVPYWLKGVLQVHPRWTIYVLAPTNKALDVLRVKCAGLPDNVVFYTIDSFLGNRIKKNEDLEVVKHQGKGQENPDLIVCDEASMVKAEYRTSLLRRGVKTLWVGDPAQLPPIDEALSACFTSPHKFLMTEVVRFEGSIIKIATMLRQRIESAQPFYLPDVKALKEDNTVSFIHLNSLHDWALNAVSKGLDSRIVAFTNIDVNNHNKVLHETLFPHAPLFGIGEKVVVNETFELNSEEMLYNGEMLTVTSCELAEPSAGVVIYSVSFTRDSDSTLEIDGVAQPKDPYTVQVALDEGHMLRTHKSLTNKIWELRREVGSEPQVRELLALRKPLNRLAPLRHSYSCTVHKSQGSTYDVCFCDWGSIFRSQDRARMMYVANTRPSKFLVIASR